MDTRRLRKFEFAVLVVVVGILALWLMRALGEASEDVEAAAVQSEVAAMRVELLDWLSHREAVGGNLPTSHNPVRWVGRAPVPYLGELDVPPEARGVWYYDLKREELVYRFHSPREARFRLVRGAATGNVPGMLAGVGLLRVDNVAERVN